MQYLSQTLAKFVLHEFKTLSTQSKRIGNLKALPKCLVD